MSVRDLHIDKAKVGSAQVLRCEGWTGPLIVSGKIKDALERMGATGTKRCVLISSYPSSISHRSWYS
jgi:hypothetical protein